MPLVNRVIPVITDEYVDIEFGTGCLKITPAHDINDYLIGQKYGLDIIDIFTPDGKLNEKAQFLVGEDRFVARDKIMTLLSQAGNVEKTEDYVNNVGYSERTDVAIEPRLSEQWFLKMDELAKPALDVVLKDVIKFFPPKFKIHIATGWKMCKIGVYLGNCGGDKRFPWYLPDGKIIVAINEAEALKEAQK